MPLTKQHETDSAKLEDVQIAIRVARKHLNSRLRTARLKHGFLSVQLLCPTAVRLYDGPWWGDISYADLATALGELRKLDN